MRTQPLALQIVNDEGARPGAKPGEDPNPCSPLNPQQTPWSWAGQPLRALIRIRVPEHSKYRTIAWHLA